MIRKSLAEKEVGMRNNFRWRGGEVLRIEGFSDAVFAFALTLLVVSLEVPKTFNELLITMRGFVAFAICFALLTFLWYEHYKFFRRYGLDDSFTITLNSILLFVVLFYVYPLKFVFTLVIGQLMGTTPLHNAPEPLTTNAQAQLLMVVYGAGYLAVFLLFALLYHHALRKKEILRLTDIEIYDTKTSISGSLIHVSVASLSIYCGTWRRERICGMGGVGLLPPWPRADDSRNAARKTAARTGNIIIIHP